jgi:hypothetical protein
MFIDLLRSRGGVFVNSRIDPLSRKRLTCSLRQSCGHPLPGDSILGNFWWSMTRRRSTDCRRPNLTAPRSWPTPRWPSWSVRIRTNRMSGWKTPPLLPIILHLTATDLGLGSCWIQLRERDYDDSKTAGEYAADVLGLPARMVVSAIMAIGYPAQQLSPPPA